MAKEFYEHTRLEKIRAGDIGRHPEHQRPSPLDRFEEKYGAFKLGKCLELVHVVKNDKPGPKWLAVNGATRVESCLENPSYGPNTRLDCKIYGNGKPPTGQELDELFLLLNCDHVSVGSEIKFKRSVGAKRQSAVFADKLIRKLGPKFKTRAGVWKVVERYGEQVAQDAVDFAIDVWGTDQPMPGQIIKALAAIFENEENAEAIRKRRSALRKRTPENIRLLAQTKMLGQVGKRDDATTWTVRTLLGHRA